MTIDPVEPQQQPDLADLPAPVHHEIVPAFAPVPREKDRANGWKPEVQRAFIEALAETGSVKAACRRVGRADHGVYLLRRHPEAEEFRRAWDAALDIGIRRIEDVAMDRALNGVEQPVYSHGKLVGSRTVHNDRLLMFMLRTRASERFGGGNGKEVSPLRLAQLKQRWRKEWEDERAARTPSPEAIRASIMRKWNEMRDHAEQAERRQSPRVRALREAYEQAAREEERCGRPEPLPLLPGVYWAERREGEAEAEDGEWEEMEE